MFNYVCACKTEPMRDLKKGEKKLPPCNRTVEDMLELQGFSVISALLGISGGGLSCLRAKIVDTEGDEDNKLEEELIEVLFELAIIQLAQPCISSLSLANLSAGISQLNHRWATFHFNLKDAGRHVNAGRTQHSKEECNEPQKVVNPKDPALIKRLHNFAASTTAPRISQRIYQWYQEHQSRLWEQPLALCSS